MIFHRPSQPPKARPTLPAQWLSLVAPLALCAAALPQDHHDHDHDGHEHVSERDGHRAHGDDAEARDRQDHTAHASHGQADQDHHDEHDKGVVRIDAATLQEFDIQLAPIGPGVLNEQVILPGEIEFNREQLAYATPRYRGTIRDIRARLAATVKEGQVLAVLENPETLRPFEVIAPFDGTIVAYDVTPGQTVDAGTPLFTVANLSTVWADLQIYQRNIAEVHEGQKVTIIGGHDMLSYQGTIAYIAPTIDEHTRTGLARVIVDNSHGQWKPGQFIRGIVSVEEHPVELLLPRSAILTMDGERVVFVKTGEVFEPRPVSLGHSDEEAFQLLDGLQAGDIIVVRNPISLKAEMGKSSFGGHGHAH